MKNIALVFALFALGIAFSQGCEGYTLLRPGENITSASPVTMREYAVRLDGVSANNGNPAAISEFDGDALLWQARLNPDGGATVYNGFGRPNSDWINVQVCNTTNSPEKSAAMKVWITNACQTDRFSKVPVGGNLSASGYTMLLEGVAASPFNSSSSWRGEYNSANISIIRNGSVVDRATINSTDGLNSHSYISESREHIYVALCRSFNGPNISFAQLEFEYAAAWEAPDCPGYPVLMLGENISSGDYSARFSDIIFSQDRPAVLDIFLNGTAIGQVNASAGTDRIFTNPANGDRLNISVCNNSKHAFTINSYWAAVKIARIGSQASEAAPLHENEGYFAEKNHNAEILSNLGVPIRISGYGANATIISEKPSNREFDYAKAEDGDWIYVWASFKPSQSAWNMSSCVAYDPINPDYSSSANMNYSGNGEYWKIISKSGIASGGENSIVIACNGDYYEGNENAQATVDYTGKHSCSRNISVTDFPDFHARRAGIEDGYIIRLKNNNDADCGTMNASVHVEGADGWLLNYRKNILLKPREEKQFVVGITGLNGANDSSHSFPVSVSSADGKSKGFGSIYAYVNGIIPSPQELPLQNAAAANDTPAPAPQNATPVANATTAIEPPALLPQNTTPAANAPASQIPPQPMKIVPRSQSPLEMLIGFLRSLFGINQE